MKKYLTYMAAASVVMGLVSCNKNEPLTFDDANAFISFESASVTVSEEGETIGIPVSLASVAGLEGSVTFKVTADTVEKSGKKFYPQEGVNYKLLTQGGTLKFNAQKRIDTIKIQGLYFPEYTGDLTLKISLESKTQKLGYNKACNVTITDIDYPFSQILGDFEATSSEAASENPWTISIYKDAKDDHKIWFENIFANSGWAASDTRCYGNIIETGGVLTKINIPLGQAVEYKYSGSPCILAGLTLTDDVVTTGSVDVTVTENGGTVTLDFGPDYGFLFYIDSYGPFSGCVGYAYPQITAVKQ